jgi:hypothetical protein
MTANAQRLRLSLTPTQPRACRPAQSQRDKCRFVSDLALSRPGPDMVRLGDRHAAKQVGINLVAGRYFAGVGARNQRHDPHHWPSLL